MACGGGEPAPKPVEAPPAPEAAALGELDPSKLSAEAEKKYALVPSPVETQGALTAAGIDTQLAALVPADRGFNLAAADGDRVAVRTGVVVADMLLTTKSSSNEALLAQIATIRTGMGTLGGGKDIEATLDDLAQRITAGALDREVLLKEFEELSQVVIPELEFNGAARTVPLIQAGSWLAGANLVARAAQEKGNPEAVGAILKQAAVVDYFAEFAKANLPEGAPAEVANALDATLVRLKGIATKSEPLTGEDLQVVIDSTSAVLLLL